MISANKRHDELSRRSLLTGGLAAGFVLGLPSAASRRGQRAGAAGRRDRRQVRAQRLHPHRRNRQGHAGDAAGRDGPGRLHGDSDDPRRRTRRRYRASRAAARAAERQALRQSDLRPAGDRQFKLDPCLLEAAAEAPAPARAPCWCRPQPQQWQVEAASCTTSKSEVTHTASGRKALLWRAGDRREQRRRRRRMCRSKTRRISVYIGQPLKRLDTPDKVNGKAVYGIDAMLPDMKFATVAACPVFGGKVGKVDDSAAKKIPGVRKIVVLDDMVAVIGDHMWAAKKGLDALKIDWDEGPNAKISSKDIWQRPARGQRKGRRGRQIGRRHRQGTCDGRQVRGGIRAAVPRACGDGAAERHRSRQAGCLRDLDRHADRERGCSRKPPRRRACRSRR